MPARILMVDDEPMVRKTFEMAMRLEGHEPASVADGDAAVVLLSQGGFDLLLLDMNLDGESGADVLARLRQLPQGATQRVVLLSGGESGELKDACAKLGAVGWLCKPYTLAQLSAAVRQHMSS